MTYEISVENIKCGGCAGTITKRLNALDTVDDCQVDIENGVITVVFVESAFVESIDGESCKVEVAQLLLKLGYPETGSVEGLKAATTKAKSFVSCAVGKMGN
jgi:copper chaperone